MNLCGGQIWFVSSELELELYDTGSLRTRIRHQWFNWLTLQGNKWTCYYTDTLVLGQLHKQTYHQQKSSCNTPSPANNYTQQTRLHKASDGHLTLKYLLLALQTLSRLDALLLISLLSSCLIIEWLHVSITVKQTTSPLLSITSVLEVWQLHLDSSITRVCWGSWDSSGCLKMILMCHKCNYVNSLCNSNCSCISFFFSVSKKMLWCFIVQNSRPQ